MRFSTVQRTLGQLRSRQAEVTEQISTGRRINAPSDDPVAAAALSRLKAQATRAQDFRKTITTVRGDTSLSERMLAEASSLMVRARELAIQGANGTLTTSNRLMLADQVAELKEQLVSTANARGTRGYLFSGNQTATAAVDAGGVYQGDTAQHRVEIAPGVVTAVTVTGSQAFTAAGGVDAFATLDALEAALRADDTGQVSGTLGDLEASREQITRAQADAGLILNRLDSADEALSISELQHAERAAELGEVDVFAAISELSSLSTALEQAIGVARLTFDNDRQLF